MKSPSFRVVAAGLSAAVSLLVGPGCRERGPVGDTRASSLEAGWRQYGYGAFDEAAETFARLARRAPEKSAERLQALYGEATIWNLRRPGEDAGRAEKLYRQVLALDPASDFAAWSLLALARMRALPPVGTAVDVPAVDAAYRRVVDQYPFHPAGEEAFICQQVALIQTFKEADARAARAALERFTATHGQSRFLAAAHVLLADCSRVLNEPERRLAEEIAAFTIHEAQARQRWEQRPVGTFVYNDPATLFKIAHLAEFECGDFDTARRYYRRFLDQNPTEKRGFYARQALERMDRAEAEIRATLAVPSPS